MPIQKMLATIPPIKASIKNQFSILKSQTAKSVAMLMTGTLISQSINVATTPALTRIYGPKEIGLMGSFNALISIVMPISAMCYSLAIVLPKRNSEARTLFTISIIVSAVTSLCFALTITFIPQTVGNCFDFETTNAIIFLIPLSMFFAGVSDALVNWICRSQLFMSRAVANVAHTSLTSTSRILFGLISPSALTLIAISTLSHLLNATLLLIAINTDRERAKSRGHRSVCDRRAVQSLNFRRMLRTANRYREFPLYRAPQNALNAVSQGLPLLLLTSAYGPSVSGFYSIATTTVSIPVSLLGSAVTTVLYPKLNRSYSDGKDTLRILNSSTALLALIGVFFFLPFITTGPSLFSFLLGKEWQYAGTFAQWLAIWSFCALINRPSVAAIPVVGLQKQYLVFDIVFLIVRISTILITMYFSTEPLPVVIAFCTVSSVFNILLIMGVNIRLKRVPCRMHQQ